MVSITGESKGHTSASSTAQFLLLFKNVVSDSELKTFAIAWFLVFAFFFLTMMVNACSFEDSKVQKIGDSI